MKGKVVTKEDVQSDRIVAHEWEMKEFLMLLYV